MITKEEIEKVIEKVRRHDTIVQCPKCKEKYFSLFDKTYTTLKGVCFICEEDEELAEKIFETY